MSEKGKKRSGSIGPSGFKNVWKRQALDVVKINLVQLLPTLLLSFLGSCIFWMQRSQYSPLLFTKTHSYARILTIIFVKRLFKMRIWRAQSQTHWLAYSILLIFRQICHYSRIKKYLVGRCRHVAGCSKKPPIRTRHWSEDEMLGRNRKMKPSVRMKLTFRGLGSAIFYS